MGIFLVYYYYLCAHWQEMALFEAAWDGDVEGVIHALKSGVCVDVTRPVSHYQYEPEK